MRRPLKVHCKEVVLGGWPVIRWKAGILAERIHIQLEKWIDSTSLCFFEREWRKRIYSPTEIVFLEGLFFIVDWGHGRILYSNEFNENIDVWKTLSSKLAGPHSIATDGRYYITEDTGRHRLFVFKKTLNESFCQVQIIPNIGCRPHRVVYSKKTERFYVLASESQEMFVLGVSHKGPMAIENIQSLSFLENAYTRSFCIIDDAMYFVSGPGKIIVTSFENNNYDVLAEFALPEAMWSMNDIQKIGDYYYVSYTLPSSGEGNIIRTRNLSKIREGEYEDLTSLLGFKGVPYHVSLIDGRLYIAELAIYTSIVSCELTPHGEIRDVKKHFDYGPAIASSKKRKKLYPI